MRSLARKMNVISNMASVCFNNTPITNVTWHTDGNIPPETEFLKSVSVEQSSLANIKDPMIHKPVPGQTWLVTQNKMDVVKRCQSKVTKSVDSLIISIIFQHFPSIYWAILGHHSLQSRVLVLQLQISWGNASAWSGCTPITSEIPGEMLSPWTPNGSTNV